MVTFDYVKGNFWHGKTIGKTLRFNTKNAQKGNESQCYFHVRSCLVYSNELIFSVIVECENLAIFRRLLIFGCFFVNHRGQNGTSFLILSAVGAIGFLHANVVSACVGAYKVRILCMPAKDFQYSIWIIWKLYVSLPKQSKRTTYAKKIFRPEG